VLGQAASLPPLQVELVTMTGNVAQVFVSGAEWAAVLAAARAALRPGGLLVFETRDPARRAWQEWTPERSRAQAVIPGAGPVRRWAEVIQVRGGLVAEVRDAPDRPGCELVFLARRPGGDHQDEPT